MIQVLVCYLYMSVSTTGYKNLIVILCKMLVMMDVTNKLYKACIMSVTGKIHYSISQVAIQADKS